MEILIPFWCFLSDAGKSKFWRQVWGQVPFSPVRSLSSISTTQTIFLYFYDIRQTSDLAQVLLFIFWNQMQSNLSVFKSCWNTRLYCGSIGLLTFEKIKWMTETFLACTTSTGIISPNISFQMVKLWCVKLTFVGLLLKSGISSSNMVRSTFTTLTF